LQDHKDLSELLKSDLLVSERMLNRVQDYSVLGWVEEPAAEASDLLDDEGAALIALWVWHFPWQAKDFNIPNGAAQPLLMKRVAQFNMTHARLGE